MRSWKQKKAYLRKQVRHHQKEHLHYMKNILKENELDGVVIQVSNGARGRVRPEIKASPNIYEPYEFVFFPFGVGGHTMESKGVSIEKGELVELFEAEKRK